MFTLVIFILIAAIGFMMGVVYKQTNTTAKIFQPNPQSLLKIFFWVLGIGTVVTFLLSWYASSQLNASNVPADDSVKFQNAKSIMIFMMNVFFFALVILSNAHSLALKKLAPLPYVLTIAFFVGFVLKDAYFVSDYYTIWQKSLKLLKGNLPDIHSTGWIKCWLGTSVTAFNAMMVWWGMRK
jgi:hypothetical protein